MVVILYSHFFGDYLEITFFENKEYACKNHNIDDVFLENDNFCFQYTMDYIIRSALSLRAFETKQSGHTVKLTTFHHFDK